MKYQELLNEYQELIRSDMEIQSKLQEIPAGYIAIKRISGKEYFYLQYTYQGKKKSEYIHEEKVAEIRHQIEQREPLKQRMESVRQDQKRLEDAAKILDTNLSRTFIFLKQCAQMDALPIAKRPDVLQFANAMTALEGLPAKPATERGLQDWAKGTRSFVDIYMKALCDYRVVEAM